MADFKVMQKCFLCGDEYQHGAHIYNGRAPKGYGFGVCKTCYESNWDGWGPYHEPKILAYLKKKGMPIPKRNKHGWLPRDIQ